jgi:hypothetical protein
MAEFKHLCLEYEILGKFHDEDAVNKIHDDLRDEMLNENGELSKKRHDIFIASVVSLADDLFINWLIEQNDVLDTGPINATKGDYVASAFADRITKLIRLFDDEAEEHVFIATPLLVSIMQAASRREYTVALEGQFKGPNWNNLAGALEGRSVYSCLLHSNKRPCDGIALSINRTTGTVVKAVPFKFEVDFNGQ